MKTIEAAIEKDIARIVNDEILAEAGDAISSESRQKLAARLIKVINDYNREVTMVVMQKAQQLLTAQAVASAAKDVLADSNNK